MVLKPQGFSVLSEEDRVLLEQDVGFIADVHVLYPIEASFAWLLYIDAFINEHVSLLFELLLKNLAWNSDASVLFVSSMVSCK